MKDLFLQTERLYLRKMTINDFDDIAQMLKNPSVMYSWEYDFEDSDVMDWILKNINLYKKSGLGYFVAVNKLSNEIVGQMALMNDKIGGENYYEIGYILKKEHWGNGYAIECARALFNYATVNYPNSEIIFEIRPENERSKKVAIKLGAKEFGSFTKTVRSKQMKHSIYKMINITNATHE